MRRLRDSSSGVLSVINFIFLFIPAAVVSKIEDGLVPDALEALALLRAQRGSLVQTPAQLEFCYDVAIAAAKGELGGVGSGGGAESGPGYADL